MRINRRHMVALLGASLIAAGCGSDEEEPKPSIPAANVQELEQYLDEVQRRFEDGTDDNNVGACQDIEEKSFPDIQRILDGLPPSVDPEVKDTLEDGLARLRELTQEGCAGVEPPETETTEETTPLETETTPPETVTEPPETTTAPPETTPEQPTTPEQDPGGGGGGTQVPEGDG